MTTHASELRAALDELPVIDAHQHLLGHECCTPRDDVTNFITGFYMNSMLRFADHALAEQVYDIERSDRERWAAFIKLWPMVRYTGYGSLIERILLAWDVEPRLTEASYDAIRAKLQARSPELSRVQYQQAKITHTVSHYLGHPSLGGLANIDAFLKEELTFKDGFCSLLGVLGFHEYACRDQVEAVAALLGRDVTTLTDLEAVIDDIVERAFALGAVGMKDHSAYTRGLGYGEPDRACAEKEFEALMKGAEFERCAHGLSDYLFARLLGHCADHDLPMAIHTGFLVAGAWPKSRVALFMPTLERFPNVRFDLFHLNFPWYEEYIQAAKCYPNVWTNACWTHVTDPIGARNFLERALGTIPTSHVFGFGGDFMDTPEPTIAHLDMAKDQIAEVLGNAVSRRWCSRESAVEIARAWLYESPKAFYRLSD